MVQLFKPATPGFLTTLAATALLAVVSFSVPYFKSVYFLKAAISQSGVNGSVTFGVMGYCLDFNNQVTCSNATVGWEFNPNALLGNDLPIQIPNVVVKWITYALVLHIVALGLAGVSTVFGLLAHVREMTMTCFSSCISGMAAAVCLIAFIFDLVLFFLIRARVNKVEGGSAVIGNGLWLTLAAWVLLFFAGCMFTFGRCCVSKRPKRSKTSRAGSEDGGKYDRESERMRLDAVKAEVDRKARQKASGQEVGLPAFYEHERTPLHRNEPQYYEEEVEVIAPYSDASRPGGPRRDPSHSSQGSAARRGVSPGNTATYRSNRAYEPAVPGTRAIDDYFNNTAPVATVAAPAANTYPPQRQPSQAQSYEPQRYQSPSYDAYAQQNAAPQRYQSPSQDPYRPNFVDPYAQQQQQGDPYLGVAGYADGRAHGHQGQDSSYHSAASHQQYPSYPQQPAQDPYATSSYNPQAATLSPPEVTHYQSDQGYAEYNQQHGYDSQQAYNHAAQQVYVQPEPQHFNQPAAGYDPYQEQQPQTQTRQPTMPQPYDPYNQQPSYEPPRTFVASPPPMESPPYSPSPRLGINTAVAGMVGNSAPSAGPSQPPAHHWSGTQEGAGEAPPPQYDAMGASGYPSEKR